MNDRPPFLKRVFGLVCVTGTLLSALALTACATPATQLPSVDELALRSEALVQERLGLQAQLAQRQRLSAIGRPILRDNAPLCRKTRRDIGVLIHAEDDYPKELRLAAARELGAQVEPSILYVTPGSPADKAGLTRGDAILFGGVPVDAKNRDLKDALQAERAELTIKRNGQIITAALKPETLCRSHLRYSSRTAVNAIATGRTITVTHGMMEFTQSDDELAQVIGHELAHNMMGHIRKVAGNMVLSGLAKRYARPFESEADYVGLYLMVRAGFDPAQVEQFWRRLAEVDPRSVNRARTHPTFPDRYLRIAAARAEIEAKQAAGAPLIPNLRPGKDAFRPSAGEGPDA